MLDKIYQNHKIEAVQLFSAGYCNLNCSYCYIPKVQFLKDVHKKIVNKIESGTYLNELKEIHGEQLTSISHWGTEPTLTISKFKNFYKEAVKVFPKLNKIWLSSNFISNTDDLIHFIQTLPQERNFEITIQISLDGPPEITDKNRGTNSTIKIKKNLLKLIVEINKNDTNVKIKCHFKPTATDEDIAYLSEFQNTKTYYDFFEDFFSEIIEHNKNNKVLMLRNCNPTIVLPCICSKQDGVNFFKLYQNQLELQRQKIYKNIHPESEYYFRFKEKFAYLNEFFTKQRMFTCAAADSQIALGENRTIQPCHRTFYLDNDQYAKTLSSSALSQIYKQNFDNNRIDILKTNLVSIDNVNEVIRMLYVNRAYHDFAKFRLTNGVAIALELQKCDQISSCYSNPELSQLLSLLVQICVECPLEQIFLSGNTFIPQLDAFRLFGNGTAEDILRRVIGELNGKL